MLDEAKALWSSGLPFAAGMPSLTPILQHAACEFI